MVPKFDKLIEFSGMFKELLEDTTEITPNEIEIHFKTNKDVISKINEDFWYRTGHTNRKGMKESANEIDITLNGMNFIYKIDKTDLKTEDLDENEDVVAKNSNKPGFFSRLFRKKH